MTNIITDIEPLESLIDPNKLEHLELVVEAVKLLNRAEKSGFDIDQIMQEAREICVGGSI